MRRLAALLPLLSACGGPPGATAATPVECALDGAAGFEPLCTLERPPGRAGQIVVRGPNGGFRRLVVTHDGRGVAAADGAEPAKVTIVGKGLIEVSVGADRYRIPAQVR